MAVRRKITKHEEFRRSRGYSVTELARAMGLSHSYISRVEAGEVKPSKRYKETFSKVLGLPKEFVFGEEDGK